MEKKYSQIPLPNYSKKQRIELTTVFFQYEGEYERKIRVEIRYIDNMLAHFFVSCGFNYTFGFPKERLFIQGDISSIAVLRPYW